MGAQIIPFGARSSSVEAAWERYATLARLLPDNPELASNLEHMMAVARAYDEWQRLFLASENAA